jgi:uncharacterized protein YndB with AHSA1/START domain
MRLTATRELLASREDVWRFIAEPHHLPDWWPNVVGVQPDRRGFAPGARWRLQQSRPQKLITSYLRKPQAAGTLILIEISRPQYVSFQFVDERVDVELRLAESAPDRTSARLEVQAVWGSVPRSLPRQALARLHALVQTAASI